MDTERLRRKRDDKEGRMKGERIIPMLPLRDIVIFPHMVVPLLVGRKRSINALEEAMAKDKKLFLAAQKDAKIQEPEEKVFRLLKAEIEIIGLERKIHTRVHKQIGEGQKEYFLNEQMRAIQKELGEKDEFKSEIDELEARRRKKKMSKEAHEKVKKEIKRLGTMSPMSPEGTVVRNYIDWILSLPWQEYTQEEMDIEKAEHILEEDHYGLKKVKERMLEYLAVRALVDKMKPLLSFYISPAYLRSPTGFFKSTYLVT
jgi:ATP-dependent Lon protease